MLPPEGPPGSLRVSMHPPTQSTEGDDLKAKAPKRQSAKAPNGTSSAVVVVVGDATMLEWRERGREIDREREIEIERERERETERERGRERARERGREIEIERERERVRWRESALNTPTVLQP